MSNGIDVVLNRINRAIDHVKFVDCTIEADLLGPQVLEIQGVLVG